MPGDAGRGNSGLHHKIRRTAVGLSRGSSVRRGTGADGWLDSRDEPDHDNLGGGRALCFRARLYAGPQPASAVAILADATMQARQMAQPAMSVARCPSMPDRGEDVRAT